MDCQGFRFDLAESLARERQCFGLRLAGDAIEEVDARGNRLVDATLVILLNAPHEPVNFVLPAHRPRLRWKLVLDTRGATGKAPYRLIRGGKPYELEARSLVLLRSDSSQRSGKV